MKAKSKLVALGGGTAARGGLIPDSSHTRWIARGTGHSQSLPVLMLPGAFMREKLERKLKPLYVQWWNEMGCPSPTQSGILGFCDKGGRAGANGFIQTGFLTNILDYLN